MTLPAAWPALYATFFVGAEQVLREASVLSLEALRERVTSLRAPLANEHHVAQQHATAQLASTSAASVLRSALAGQPDAAVYYALLTVCTATGPVMLAPAGPPTVLDCPLEPELGPSLWLSLAAARLRWSRGALSCLWSPTRLLLALGPAPDQLLAYSATKQHTSTRLWPLTTERAEAIERARALLAPTLTELSRATVAELCAQFAHVSC